jgi:transposase-like protein
VTQYPKEFKESIIAKMLPPNNMSVSRLTKETGIPKDTLYTWRSKNLKAHRNITQQPLASGELNSEEKFTSVIESASLNEVELNEYCRTKGLYPAQLSAWRNSCMQANSSVPNKLDRSKLKTQAKQIKQLEIELRRKDKALAETAALLVLQKKVQALWGDPEDEK